MVLFFNDSDILVQAEDRAGQQKRLRHVIQQSTRHIVNLDHVEQVAPNDAGGLDLTLHGQSAIEVSRRRAPQFKALASL